MHQRVQTLDFESVSHHFESVSSFWDIMHQRVQTLDFESVSHHFESAPSFWYIMHQSVQTLTHYRQMFFKHFASKNQLPGFYISGTLVENGLNKTFHSSLTTPVSRSFTNI